MLSVQGPKTVAVGSFGAKPDTEASLSTAAALRNSALSQLTML